MDTEQKQFMNRASGTANRKTVQKAFAKPTVVWRGKVQGAAGQGTQVDLVSVFSIKKELAAIQFSVFCKENTQKDKHAALAGKRTLD